MTPQEPLVSLFGFQRDDLCGSGARRIEGCCFFFSFFLAKETGRGAKTLGENELKLASTGEAKRQKDELASSRSEP